MVSYYPMVLMLGISLIWFMWRYALVFMDVYREKNFNIGRVYREFLLCLLVLLGLVIIFLTFSPFKIPLYNFNLKGNLILFHSIYKFIKLNAYLSLLINVIGNLLLLTPTGFLLAILYTNLHSYKKMLMVGFIISLLIESLQLVLRVRFFDVDDLLLNSISCMIGYYLYLKMVEHSVLFENIVEGKISKNKINFKKIIFPIVLMFIFSISLYTYSFINNSITKKDFIIIKEKTSLLYEQGLQKYLLTDNNNEIEFLAFNKLPISRYYLINNIKEECLESCYNYLVMNDYAGYDDDLIVVLFGKNKEKEINKIIINDKEIEVLEDKLFVVGIEVSKKEVNQKLEIKYLIDDEVIFEIKS